MLSIGKRQLELYTHILNVDETIFKLNPIIEKFGYKFIRVDASEFEKNFSKIFIVPKAYWL